MRRHALPGLAIAAAMSVLATPASACGYCDCRGAGYYGYAAYGYAPRAYYDAPVYSYSYYRPRVWGYSYGPTYYSGYGGWGYRPRVWGWRRW
jgi:hypothetical protein